MKPGRSVRHCAITAGKLATSTPITTASNPQFCMGRVSLPLEPAAPDLVLDQCTNPSQD
jgi:hypothetical protein